MSHLNVRFAVVVLVTAGIAALGFAGLSNAATAASHATREVISHSEGQTMHEIEGFGSWTPVQTLPVMVVYGTAPKARVWACGAPRGLSTDAVQTVRDCEWR